MKRKIVRRSIAAHLLYRGADLPVCRYRGFPNPQADCAAQPTWKSALRQAWLAALPRGCATRSANPSTVTAACVAWWRRGRCLRLPPPSSPTVPMQGSMVMPKLYYHAERPVTLTSG